MVKGANSSIHQVKPTDTISAHLIGDVQTMYYILKNMYDLQLYDVFARCALECARHENVQGHVRANLIDVFYKR